MACNQVAHIHSSADLLVDHVTWSILSSESADMYSILLQFPSSVDAWLGLHHHDWRRVDKGQDDT